MFRRISWLCSVNKRRSKVDDTKSKNNCKRIFERAPKNNVEISQSHPQCVNNLIVESIFSTEERFLKRGTYENYISNGTFHEAVGPILAMAQCFAVMPVNGIKATDATKLYYRWNSVRTIFSIVVFVMTIIYTVLTIAVLFTKSLEFDAIVPVIFYGSVLYGRICFIQLAIKWPQLMQQWDKVERDLPKHHCEIDRSKLAYKLKMISIIVMTLSLTEHILNIISIISHNDCHINPTDPLKDYFMAEQSQLFAFMSYSSLVAFIGKLLNVMNTFVWTYMDLFVMLISVGLSSRFMQINDNLFKHKGMIMPESFWAENRMFYRNMCNLCDTIDNGISKITIISFANNLFFVCVQLLRSLNKMPSFAHALYFWFSLFFLIARTLAVSLYAADVNDESKKPILVFRSVPRESWCMEVKRFSDEVTNDVVALTGLRFFHITRKLVLAVAGTIVTYELVLIQFHKDDKFGETC